MLITGIHRKPNGHIRGFCEKLNPNTGEVDTIPWFHVPKVGLINGDLAPEERKAVAEHIGVSLAIIKKPTQRGVYAKAKNSARVRAHISIGS